MIEITCPQCGDLAVKATGSVNRSRRKGAPVYCSKKCAGLARRHNRSEKEAKALKAAYDREYSAKNAETLKAKKAEYHRRTYDPAKAAVQRKKRSKAHVEYCRRPEYREWKREYDRKHRAKKDYGEYADCFLLAMDLRMACLERATSYEIRQTNGVNCKSQQRKRDYERTHSNKPETGPLGNAG